MDSAEWLVPEPILPLKTSKQLLHSFLNRMDLLMHLWIFKKEIIPSEAEGEDG